MMIIDRTGETRTMNNGLTAKIIAYRKAVDIDVCFIGVDGQPIVSNREYSRFIRGQINCPMICKTLHDGVSVEAINPNTGASFLIDKEDVKILGDVLWHDVHGYMENSHIGKFHRIIMNAPKNKEVDHINGDRRDNRRYNLRICDSMYNRLNRKKVSVPSTSKYKGVRNVSNGAWVARIRSFNKRYYLGRFNTEVEAARAYNEAAKKYHGEFARLNKIETDAANIAA